MIKDTNDGLLKAMISHQSCSLHSQNFLRNVTLALIRSEKAALLTGRSPAEILIDAGPCLAPGWKPGGPRGSVQTDGKEDGVGRLSC